MAIPDYQTCMLPLLKHYGDGQEHTNRDSIDTLAKGFKLTDEERRMMLPSGVQGLFDNRVNWARTYMKKAALIYSPKRGVHKITKRGLDVLKKKPERIDVAYLGQFQEFKDFRALRHTKEETEESELDLNHQTPEESLYIQAKRWENTVGRPEIQKFIGALAQQRAKKGLFITTSSFSSDAEDCVSRIEAKVVLIDGETLAQMMIDHNVGVSTMGTYEVKKIDSDYFSEE